MVIAPDDCDLRLIGNSSGMRKVRELIARVAPTDSTVLICGESGCGKELVAESVHAMSPRAGKPFVAINCAAIPATLIEAELFGHERGSFTGATARREGVFERANGGTLLLDEITEMPLDLQSRLLRVLETKRLNRVGGSADLPVDVRVIASTNRLPATLRQTRLPSGSRFSTWPAPAAIESPRGSIATNRQAATTGEVACHWRFPAASYFTSTGLHGASPAPPPTIASPAASTATAAPNPRWPGFGVRAH